MTASGRSFTATALAGSILILLLAVYSATSASAEALYAWVQVGPGNAAQARAIVKGGSPCPQVELEGRPHAMRVRAPAQAAGDFTVTSCQIDLPAVLQTLRLGGEALPVPRAAPRRIVVIGDTGCRIKKSHVQDCDDAAVWPFPALASAVAAAAPDLIVHVGDYLYRESPCPEEDHGCAGSHWGYNWGTWQEDFFAPATAMFAQAPMLFLRGNHETCKRAWRGWYRFLAETDWTPECHRYAAPWAVTIEGRRLIVLDTTHADDSKAKSGQVASFASLLHAVNGLAAGELQSWLVTHKPFWSLNQVHGADGRHPHAAGLNVVLQAAAAQAPLAPGIEIILSGHYHLFQALSFRGLPARPGQVVLGNGGTELDTGLAQVPEGIDAWGREIAHYALIERFGFALLESTGADWTLTLHDPAGLVFANCVLAARNVACDISK